MLNVLLLRSLGTVLGTGLAAVCYAGSIKSTADDVVSCTRKVLNTAATDHNNTMLLKVVAFTGDIGSNFNTVGQTYSGDLSER